MEKKLGHFVCLGGILTAITVLLQAAPIYLPIIGLVLSPFSSLPVALAAISGIALGMWVFLAATIILALISIEEMLIFLFTTGILGLTIGLLIYRKGAIAATLLSGIFLTLGLLSITYLIGMTAFQEISRSLSSTVTGGLYFFFSLVYAGIWSIIIKKFNNKCVKILKP